MSEITKLGQKKKVGMVRVAAFKVEMLRLAARPDGFAATDIAGHPPNIFTAAQQLVKEGRLFKVKFSHKVVRYYADARAAKALTPKPASMQITVGARQRATWSADEPGVVNEKTVFTVCPSPSVGAGHRKQVSGW